MKTNIKFQTVLLVGAIWGFFEASMGIYVKGVCGYQMTGSVMTGIAIFFMTLGYSYSKETKSILQKEYHKFNSMEMAQIRSIYNRLIEAEIEAEIFIKYLQKKSWQIKKQW